MALNLKTLGTRALSALVFVVVLLACVLWNYYSFTIFFFVVSMLGLNEFYRLSEKLLAKPYKAAGFIGGVITYVSFIDTDYLIGHLNFLIYVIAILPFYIFLAALFSHRSNSIHNAIYTITGIIYAVLPFALLHNIVIPSGSFYPYILIGIILLIWSNDTFAYLGGSLFGKHKMIVRISPGKTWEGTIIGIVLTFGLSFLISLYFDNANSRLWLALGVLVPILATIGDLVESLLKRQANIKDTGNIMPGHGGILDRFDSLIFVAPVVFVIIKLL